jgi:hypothetical protein
MRLIILTLLLTLNLFAKDKIALVIGNKNYTNHTGLNNPIKDAKLIRDTLESMGFEVLEAYNKNLNGLSDKLDVFIGKARNAKIAVVYYAGHGIGVGTNNYMIPIGSANLSVDNLGRKLMSVNELKGAVAKASGFGVVLFDACRNSFFSGTISGLSSGRTSRALIQPTVKRGQNILVSFSTQAGTIAKDDVNNGNHSPYALALRDNLKSNNDIRLVMGGIKDSVESYTSYHQKPIYEASLGGKKFCLAGCGYVPPPPPPEPSKDIVKIGNLMYQNQAFTKTYTWKKAGEYCQGLTLGNYNDWRLPTRAELNKISNIPMYRKYDNYDNWQKWYDKNKHKRLKGSKGKLRFVKQEFLESMQTGSYFWTSETYKKDSSDAWRVFFNYGGDHWYSKSNLNYALCVR